LEEVIEACKAFSFSWFQLCFLNEVAFLERLTTDPASVDVFLLLSILAISAPFVPSLVKRYGGPRVASAVFSSRARGLIADELLRPTLERTQAFFVLGMCEWGNCNGQRGWMYMGIACRMAGQLRLHREETYRLPPDALPEEVIAAEGARRT
jgi:hypothetical protein